VRKAVLIVCCSVDRWTVASRWKRLTACNYCRVFTPSTWWKIQRKGTSIRSENWRWLVNNKTVVKIFSNHTDLKKFLETALLRIDFNHLTWFSRSVLQPTVVDIENRVEGNIDKKWRTEKDRKLACLFLRLVIDSKTSLKIQTFPSITK
jgi:hypothetical protein